MTCITAIPTLIGVFWLSRLFPDNPKKEEEVADFIAGVETTEQPTATRTGLSQDAAVAVSIIGAATGLIGALLAGAVALTGYFNEGIYSIGVGGVLTILGFLAWWYGKRAAGRAVETGDTIP
jgi:hypothetical protein